MDGNLTAWLTANSSLLRISTSASEIPKASSPPSPPSPPPSSASLLASGSATTRSFAKKSAALAAVGALCITLGLLWNIWFPINKKLWTSSYTLLAGGLSMLLLAASIYLVDAIRLARPPASDAEADPTTRRSFYTPLLVFGTNSILAYMISELGDSLLTPSISTQAKASSSPLSTPSPRSSPNPAWASLANSLLFMLLLCWFLVLPFYLKRIFLRI